MQGTFGKVRVKNGLATKYQIFNTSHQIIQQAVKEPTFLTFLDHPRIIEPLLINIVENQIEITMPFHTRLDPRKVKDKNGIMIKLLEGLVYMHDNQFVHADIKDANILVDDKENPYYIDFGSGKLDECKYDLLTTYFYAAPEVIQQKEVCKEGDVWSLGVVFYLIMNGISWDKVLPKELQNQKKGDPEYTDYYLLFERIPLKDPLLKGMLDPDWRTRWTARQCYKYLTGNEYQLIITPKQLVPLLTDLGEDRIEMFSRVIRLYESWKFSRETFVQFVALHDAFFSNFPDESVFSYELYSLALAWLAALLYEPDVYDYYRGIQGIPSIKMITAVKNIMTKMKFELVVESEAVESPFFISQDDNMVRRIIPQEYLSWVRNDPFHIVKPVTKDWEGTTYLVRALEDDYCLKVFENPNILDRDLNIQKQIKSEFILPVISTSETGYVTECAPFTLEDFRKLGLDVDNVMEQLRRAVNDIHRAGFVHGDLKPENILVKNGHIYITGFGNAVPIGQQRRGGSFFYLAPEVLQGKTTATIEQDIWSLGIIYAFLVTGGLLYPGFDVETQLGMISSFNDWKKFGRHEKRIREMLEKRI